MSHTLKERANCPFEEYYHRARVRVKYTVGFFPMPTSLLSPLCNHSVIWWKHTILVGLWSTEIGQIYIPWVTTKIWYTVPTFIHLFIQQISTEWALKFKHGELNAPISHCSFLQFSEDSFLPVPPPPKLHITFLQLENGWFSSPLTHACTSSPSSNLFLESHDS